MFHRFWMLQRVAVAWRKRQSFKLLVMLVRAFGKSFVQLLDAKFIIKIGNIHRMWESIFVVRHYYSYHIIITVSLRDLPHFKSLWLLQEGWWTCMDNKGVARISLQRNQKSIYKHHWPINHYFQLLNQRESLVASVGDLGD